MAGIDQYDNTNNREPLIINVSETSHIRFLEAVIDDLNKQIQELSDKRFPKNPKPDVNIIDKLDELNNTINDINKRLEEVEDWIDYENTKRLENLE